MESNTSGSTGGAPPHTARAAMFFFFFIIASRGFFKFDTAVFLSLGLVEFTDLY